jgi:hypothetical protein
MPYMSPAISVGSDVWQIATGWGSLAAAVLVTVGSLVLLHTARSAGRREMARPHDVKVMPLMTLPGFASAFLLIAVGAGQLGWLGTISGDIVDGVFGLWWLANATVTAQVARRLIEQGRPWSAVVLGVITAVIIGAGLWFARAPLEALL